ncbi:hypothetical protein Dvina_21125 [Dactylosporangium vinaceum]|uniref:Uncharacterized protein n=1 Tax=Dactylosporangium vinaceum TaxID=53362 RepID=A0ABV5MRV0_9ACTN|nr:hypothetical protein [Dactylosporangium vinaceum]UAC00336.1 hypothetical protein Dvina_21125 [Dactylosporangium vinaceum]
MSYLLDNYRTEPSALDGGSTLVAVRATHDALRNLIGDSLPVHQMRHGGDVVALVTPNVVELEHHRVGLAAVHAWMRR